jgi:hypothetical protein
VLALYDQGADLSMNGSLALEAQRVAEGPEWDAAGFAAAGRAAASRQRRSE